MTADGGGPARDALVVGVPQPGLRPWVDRYLGYREHTDRPLIRREVAGAFVVLVIGWGDPLDVVDPRCAARGAYRVDSFVAGTFDGHCLTRTVGLGTGVQVLLAPLTARRLLGLPLRELTNRAVEVSQLPGGWLSRLRPRLAEAPDWPRRFALLDAALAARLGDADPVDPRLERAWRRLTDSGGRVGVGSLADELGWSRRHLSTSFHREVGLPPKTAARLLRFHRAYAALTGHRPGAGPPVVGDRSVEPGAALAARCGYFDQSHLIRDFHEFAGVTPTELLAVG